jgi:dihydrofolate reductase
VRKIVMWNMVTIDGFFSEPDGDLGWFVFDDELRKYIDDTQDEADTILFGRKTYQMMADYWPSAEGTIATFMNSVEKVVVSTTLDRAGWNNAKLVKDDVPEEMTKLKRRKGRDIRLIGSADLASTSIQHDLIDEYRLGINPVVLGRGVPLFKQGVSKLNLKLLHAQTLKSGVAILHYVPERKQ